MTNQCLGLESGTLYIDEMPIAEVSECTLEMSDPHAQECPILLKPLEFNFELQYPESLSYKHLKGLRAMWDMYVQSRHHRKGRVNKKYAKRYGYVLRKKYRKGENL